MTQAALHIIENLLAEVTLPGPYDQASPLKLMQDGLGNRESPIGWDDGGRGRRRRRSDATAPSDDEGSLVLPATGGELSLEPVGLTCELRPRRYYASAAREGGDDACSNLATRACAGAMRGRALDFDSHGPPHPVSLDPGARN